MNIGGIIQGSICGANGSWLVVIEFCGDENEMSEIILRKKCT